MKYNKRTLINTLNNLNWSDDNIILIKKEYFINRTLPYYINTNYKRNRFTDRFKDFEIKDNKIYFKPLNLEVIPNDKKEETLKNFYDNFNAIGNGKINFYKKIIDHYINIKRKDTDEETYNRRLELEGKLNSERLKKILENIRKKMPNVLGAEITEYKND
jgi:DNA-directed RNA polymerase beta subunit